MRLFEERRRTQYVAVSLFLVTASFMLAKTARDALYFDGGGIANLPLAYIGVAILSLPLAVMTLGLMRRLGSRRARLVVLVGTGVVLMGFSALGQPGGGALMTAFFMLVPLVYGVLFSVVWLMAADLLDGGTSAHRAEYYGQIGAASLVGGVAGALVARALAPVLDPRWFLSIAAGILIVAVVVVVRAYRRCPRSPRRHRPIEKTHTAGVKLLVREPYVWTLFTLGVTAALAGVLVEFQFYIAAATAGFTMEENAAFFANLYLALSTIALVVQLGITPKLQHRIGLRRTLLVLPGTLFVLTPALLLSGSIGLRSVLRFTEGGLKSSVHRASWEQAYVRLDASRRVPAKLMIDGAAARLAEGLGALALYSWLTLVVRGQDLQNHDASWITGTLFGVLAMWVLATLLMMRFCPPPPPPAGSEDDAGAGRVPDACPIVQTLGNELQSQEAL